LGKPVRAVARMVVGLSITITIAPLGALFHAGSLLKGSVAWLRAAPWERPAELQKIVDHAACCFQDFLFFSCAAVTCWSAFQMTILPGLGLAGLFALSLSPLIPLLMPDPLFAYYFPLKERAAVVKSLYAYNQFGAITGDELLSQKLERYDEDANMLDGTLGKLWEEQAELFLESIKQLQTVLPPKFRIAERSEIGSASLFDVAGIYKSNLIYQNYQLSNAVCSYSSRFYSMQYTRFVLERALMTKLNSLPRLILANGFARRVSDSLADSLLNTLPYFPFSGDRVKKAFIPTQAYSQPASSKEKEYPYGKPVPKSEGASSARPSAPPQDPWSEFLDQSIRVTNALSLPPVQTYWNKKYVKFQQNVMQRKSPRELMGFTLREPLNEQTIKNAYRKQMLWVHSDKNKERDLEAQELSKCLFEAQKVLSDSLKF
jgi:hypothetical protein